MRILYFVPPDTHARKFVRTFSKEHEVVAVTQFPCDEPGWISLGVRSRFRRWMMDHNARLLRKVIERERPDIVHAFHVLPSALIAVRAGARPLVISAMGADVYLRGGQISPLGEMLHLTPLPRLWHRRIRGAFDLGIVECEDAKRRMSGLGYPADRIKVIPWGPDCGEFVPSPGDERLRESLGGRFEHLVACTRSHWPVYGVEEVVRMTPFLPRNVGLVMCGSGAQTPRLRALASRLGVAERINFMGRVAQERLPSILNCCDAAVSLARSDTISVSLLEAMACGLPVLARDVGGTGEYVTHGSSGILVRDSSPEIAARELDAMLQDEPKRKRMGQRAREDVLAKADWRRCAPAIDAEYRSLARA